MPLRPPHGAMNALRSAPEACLQWHKLLLVKGMKAALYVVGVRRPGKNQLAQQLAEDVTVRGVRHCP